MAREIPKNVMNTFHQANDLDFSTVSAARPLPTTDAAVLAALVAGGPTPAAIVTEFKSVTNTAAVVATADAARTSLTFMNNDAANTIYLGPSTVTTGTAATAGFPLPPGGYVTLGSADGSHLAWSAIASVAGPSELRVTRVA